MANFGAQVRTFVDKTKYDMDQINIMATSDLFRLMTRTQPSIKKTGTFKVGFVPVDTSELIQSQIVWVNNLFVSAGKGSWRVINRRMKAGDHARIAFTAEHARPIEYGVVGGVPGRVFIRNAGRTGDRN